MSNATKAKFPTAPLSAFVFHPLIKDLPLLADAAEWAEKRHAKKGKGGKHTKIEDQLIEQAGHWSFIKNDLATRQQDEPVVVVRKGAKLQIVNGRQRFTGAKELKWHELAYREVSEAEAKGIILGSELARKHLSKEAIAYTALHLHPELADNSKRGPKETEEGEFVQTLHKLADEIGVSHRTMMAVKSFMRELRADHKHGPQKVLRLFSGVSIAGMKSGEAGANSEDGNGAKRHELAMRWLGVFKTQARLFQKDAAKLGGIKSTDFLEGMNEWLDAWPPEWRERAEARWGKGSDHD